MYFEHEFAVRVAWSGDRDAGSSGHRAYGRRHTIVSAGNPPIEGSAAKAFRGDEGRWNPEQLLIASLSQCHLLSYLYAAAKAGVVVSAYHDEAVGVLRQEGEGGRFHSVTLRPVVTIAAGDASVAMALHEEAARTCFIAASVAFPVRHEPTTIVAE